MSASREATYESQNDERLDALHAKIRAVRGVTTDIYNDAERQNLMLDETGDTFSSFGSSLATSARRASEAFGLNGVGVRQCRIIGLVICAVLALWILWKLVHVFFLRA